MDVFAADLWEVYQGRAPEEYRDPETFVEKRVKGKGGDPVIQIQTPFGGGKTHAMIAMYHKAEEWGAKRVVIVGTPYECKRYPLGINRKAVIRKDKEIFW